MCIKFSQPIASLTNFSMNKWYYLILVLVPVVVIGGLLIYEYTDTVNTIQKNESNCEYSTEEGEFCSFADISRENFTSSMNDEIIRYFLKNAQKRQLAMNRIVFDGSDIKIEDCEFRLYTRTNNKNGIPIYVNNSQSLFGAGFDPSKSLVIATHGYFSGSDETWMLQLAKAQLSFEDCNFISLDWSFCANSLNYLNAVDCIRIVGKYLAVFLDFIYTQGLAADKTHLMGHSLGAHLVGQVSLYGHNVKRITGFDPAGPAIPRNDLTARLDAGDAKIVDVIHTNTFMFGYKGDLGHYDFYPNGGKKQPGCFLLDYVCRHSMSYLYYIQSLYESNKYRGKKCASLKDAWDGKCNGVPDYMGVWAVNGNPGVYHVSVTSPPSGENTSCDETS